MSGASSRAEGGRCLKSWEWDPTLYVGSAPYYLAGRLPYSPLLAQTLTDALGLDGSGRLLDVGTGPGIIPCELSPIFEEVVGIDADQDMVSEAEQESRRRGCTNARWRHLRAEQLPAGLGTFRLVTFAQSFHWMDREHVASAVRGMLEPARGSLALLSAWTVSGVETDQPLPHPSPPNEAITQLVDRYLGSIRRAGQGVLPEGTPSDEEEVLMQAGFARPRTLTAADDRVITRSVDDVIASVYAVSRSAPHLFGDQLDRFEGDLRALLSKASPDGLFSEQTAENKIRIFDTDRSCHVTDSLVAPSDRTVLRAQRIATTALESYNTKSPGLSARAPRAVRASPNAQRSVVCRFTASTPSSILSFAVSAAPLTEPPA
ncbi:MAG: class I SAM-dependent methyltransferase [Actinomycetota bacterium]